MHAFERPVGLLALKQRRYTERLTAIPRCCASTLHERPLHLTKAPLPCSSMFQSRKVMALSASDIEQIKKDLLSAQLEVVLV